MSPIPIDNVTKSEHSWLLWLKPTECPQNAAAFVMPVSKVTRAGWCALGKVLSIVVRLPTDQLFLKLVVIIRLAGGMCWGAWEALSHSPRYEPVPCWACLEHSTKLTFHLVNQILPLVKHKFYGWCCVGKVTGNNGFKLNNYMQENNVEYFGIHIE